MEVGTKDKVILQKEAIMVANYTELHKLLYNQNSETDNEESKTVALPPTMTKDKNEVRIWLTALGTSRGFCFLSVYVQHVFTVLLCRHLFQYKTG